MPINCLVKCLIKFWTVIFQNQFMVNSWTIYEHSCFKKTALSPFALRLLSPPPLSSSLVLSRPLSSSLVLSFPLFLSLFNTHPIQPANSLKTKELRKRHFRLKFLSQGKPLRLKTLGTKFAHYFSHFPADPTLHTPPETDPTCSAAKPYIM